LLLLISVFGMVSQALHAKCNDLTVLLLIKCLYMMFSVTRFFAN
jgi:hypothetical protein